MEVQGDLWIKTGGRKAPTGYTSKDWDELVSFMKKGIYYAQLFIDSDIDVTDIELSDAYHHVENGKIFLKNIREKM